MRAAIRYAAVQMVSSDHVDDNLAQAQDALAQAARAQAQVVALPEYFALMGLHDEDKRRWAEAPCALGERPGADTPMQAALSGWAARWGFWVVGGTVPLVSPQGTAVRNACTVWAPDGRLAARYDKMHLFRFQTDHEHYDEGRVLEAGESPVWAQVGGLRTGLSVCYDLRFPELYRALSRAGCEVLCVPAAFTHTTGQAHWEVLLRARAIENQAFVVAPAQGGLHRNGRRTWGHTCIIDPWGQVLARIDSGPGVIWADLDLDGLEERRLQLPALKHRLID